MLARLYPRLLPLLGAAAIAACSSTIESIPLDYMPSGPRAERSGTSVAVRVSDQRAAVLTGVLKPNEIGRWDDDEEEPKVLITSNGQPLSDNLERDLREELVALGYDVAAASVANRTLELHLREWIFSSHQTRDLTYRIEVTVSGPGRTRLLRSEITDTVSLARGRFGPDEALFVEDVARAYDACVQAIVRDNPEVRQALDSAAPLVDQPVGN